MGVRNILLLAVALAAAGCIAAPVEDAQPNEPSAPASATPASPEACVRTSAPTPTAPPSTVGGGQTSVSNQPGSFSYAESAAAKQGTFRETWQNPAGSAHVAWSGSTTAGSFTLVIKDACDKEVHRGQFGPASQSNREETTQSGQPGDWVVEMEFALYSGQISLQISAMP